MMKTQYTDRSLGSKCRAAVPLLLGCCLLLFLAGCDLRLQAIIVSPGSAEIDVAVGETVLFSGEAIGGVPFSDGEETSYRFSWDADKNAVSAPDDTATNSVEVTFDQVGLFTVSLTVTDREGNSDTASVRVNVESGVDSGQPLQAIILSPVTSPIRVVVGRTLTFKGIGAGGVPFFTGSDTVEEPYGYFWDIPGIKDVTVADNFRDVEITFSTTGLFNLFFTVKDSRGVVDTAAVQVTVTSS